MTYPSGPCINVSWTERRAVRAVPLTVRMKRFGMVGASTTCCMNAARISGRKPSDMEKQIEMAVHTSVSAARS